MGTYRVLIASLLLLAVSSAQQSQNNQFKVEGVVVNSITGKPLPRALVQLSGRAMLSGPEGEFSFAGVPAGGAQIMLTKPGFFNPGETASAWAPGRNIDVGPDTGKLLLKLVPEAVISGHVTGHDEEPLEGVGIQALRFISVEGRQVLTPARGGVRTDEDGNFRMAALPAGRYYLAVRAGNVTRRVLGAQTPKAPEAYPVVVYYPGMGDLSAAGALDLAPGQRMEVPFSLALGAAYKLAGKVAAAGEWKQINAPMITGLTGEGLLAPDLFDGATGAFEFRAVPAGTYSVRVSGADLQNRYRFSTHKINVSKSVTDLVLPLRPGAEIPIAVRTEFSKQSQPRSCSWTQPGGEVQQSDCSDYPAARVELVSPESVQLRFSTEYGPMKDPSAFALHGVAPGKYMVRAYPNGGGYVESVRSGQLDLLREMLAVPEEGTVPPIEIVLRDDPGTLQVTARVEKPGQMAMILVLPEGTLFPSPKQMGNRGMEASAIELAPGNYRVYAFDSLDGLDYGNPEVLAKYASKAASVTVTPNGNASVIVDLIHAGG